MDKEPTYKCAQCQTSTNRISVWRDLKLCMRCFKEKIGYKEPVIHKDEKMNHYSDEGLHIDGKGFTMNDVEQVKKFVKKLVKSKQ